MISSYVLIVLASIVTLVLACTILGGFVKVLMLVDETIAVLRLLKLELTHGNRSNKNQQNHKETYSEINWMPEERGKL